jgi:hypothetical protein
LNLKICFILQLLGLASVSELAVSVATGAVFFQLPGALLQLQTAFSCCWNRFSVASASLSDFYQIILQQLQLLLKLILSIDLEIII